MVFESVPFLGSIFEYVSKELISKNMKEIEKAERRTRRNLLQQQAEKRI